MVSFLSIGDRNALVQEVLATPTVLGMDHTLVAPLLGEFANVFSDPAIGPKPFEVAQHGLSTCRKTEIQTADTACLQIGGLCWYPSEDTLPLLIGLYCYTLAIFVTFGF